MALQGRPLDAVQSRGRWGALGSVMRYKKHGRYLRQKALLSQAQVQAAGRLLPVVVAAIPLAARRAHPHLALSSKEKKELQMREATLRRELSAAHR